MKLYLIIQHWKSGGYRLKNVLEVPPAELDYPIAETTLVAEIEVSPIELVQLAADGLFYRCLDEFCEGPHVLSSVDMVINDALENVKNV